MSERQAHPNGLAETRRTALALAALVFAFVAPAAYALQRIVERARGGTVDPLLVIYDLHTAFYWRASTATWWGVVAAIVAYAFAVRPGAARLRPRLARTLALTAIPFAIVLGLVMWRNP